MFARTERLLLRPGWAEDAPALASAIAHETVAFKLARLPWPYTVADAQWFLGLDRTEGDANFLIFERTSAEPQLIGGIGIDRHPEGSEIGYWLAPEYWGRGFATEAGRAVVALARDSLRIERLVSGHFVDNPASGRVLRKLGFEPTGMVEMRECRSLGKAMPCATYALDLAPMALAA